MRYAGAAGYNSGEASITDQKAAPLQLANLSVLMNNLEKTGNFRMANEEAYKLLQKKN